MLLRLAALLEGACYATKGSSEDRKAAMASVVGRNAGNRFSPKSTDLQEAVPSEPTSARHFVARLTPAGGLYFMREQSPTGVFAWKGVAELFFVFSLKIFNVFIILQVI